MPSDSTFDVDYVKSAPGILKIIEIVFGVIVIGIVTIDANFLKNGGGFVIFIAVTAFVTTLVLFILNLITVWSRLPTWRLLLEFVYFIVCMVGYFVAGVVSAVHAPKRDPAIAATAFFAFINFLAYGVDAFFAFWVWRAGVQEDAPKTTTAPPATTNVQAGGPVAY